MALLNVEDRKKRFKYLGLEYNEAGIRKLQKQYMRKQDVDGKYGSDTDKVLRHVYNVKRYAKNFTPEEFKCECGGKYCTGYPSYMKKVQLQHMQAIRDHYGKPITVTCGLRCKKYNSILRGSIDNSKHLTGYATDFYMKGVTDTLQNRKNSIKWIKKQPNHNYTYGNGIDSSGVNKQAGYMGNALHTDTKKPVTTIKKVKIDPLQKWYDAMEKQFKWSKDQNYYFVTPTVASSKKNGTCITFPAVSLQRIGLLPKGGYFYYHPTKHKISGSSATYVKKHPEIFKLSYPNKTVKQLWKEGKIKKGDIVGFGNPAYHTMVFMGMNSKGKPIFNTMGHKRALKTTYKMYENRKVNMLVRIKKI